MGVLSEEESFFFFWKYCFWYFAQKDCIKLLVNSVTYSVYSIRCSVPSGCILVRPAGTVLMNILEPCKDGPHRTPRQNNRLQNRCGLDSSSDFFVFSVSYWPCGTYVDAAQLWKSGRSRKRRVDWRPLSGTRLLLSTKTTQNQHFPVLLPFMHNTFLKYLHTFR